MARTRKKRTMFYEPPKHPDLAAIVRIDSPTAARKATQELLALAKKYPIRRTTIKRAMVLAANRAAAMRKKKNLSAKERRELKEVEEIYRRAYRKL